MKRILVLLMVGFFISCSQDETEDLKVVLNSSSFSQLENGILSFKDDESFVKEYSTVSDFKSEKEVQDWISKKGIKSLLAISDDSFEMQNDTLSDSRIIYSDALMAIFNFDSKVKIGEKIIWLNERSFYLLSPEEVSKSSKDLNLIKDKLEIYGRLLNYSGVKIDLTKRSVIPNENRVKTFVMDEGNFRIPGVRLRHVLDLYNETIVMNDKIESSKMYLRFTLQYRSCSTWRCTWKTDNSNFRHNSVSDLSTNVGNGIWTLENVYAPNVTGSRTFLLATWKIVYPLAPQFQYPNFDVSGNVNIQMADGWHIVPISWY